MIPIYIYNIYGVMWQVTAVSKIKLVSFKMSPKSLLGVSELEYIRAIDAYIFCDSLWSVLFYDVLSIFINLYGQVLCFYTFQWNLLSEVSGFGKCAMKWSSNPHLKHIFGLRPLRSLHLLLKLLEFKGDLLCPLSFVCFLKHFLVG